jgi:pyruvate kinase
MPRRTKILATLGPASEDAKTVRAMVEAGMDAARLNFSHGTHEDHRELAEKVRQAADDVNRPVALVQDLQGTKIRLREAPEDLHFQAGDEVEIDADEDPCTSSRIGVDDARLVDAIDGGSQLLLGDGEIELIVTELHGDSARARVETGGEIRSSMGITARGVDIPGGLTEKDQEDVLAGREIDVDYVAASFVGSARDVADVKEFLASRGETTPILAKIERTLALENLDEIIQASEGIMVARGDLGLALPAEEVPIEQKRLLRACQREGVVSITATQLLESMVQRSRPTRAETSDVANAILDGSQAVMLSGETAIGENPPRAVRAMADIARATEQAIDAGRVELPVGQADADGSRDDAIARSAAVLADSLDADAIVTITTSGSTALRVAKFRPKAPIVAATPRRSTYRKLALVWGVFPFVVPEATTLDTLVWEAEAAAKAVGSVEPGDTLVVAAGEPGVPGTTNLVRVADVE